MFELSRFGKNVTAEIQRWQFFLLRNSIPQAGILDGIFGANTEIGTKIFQMKYGLKESGRVDETTLGKAAELGYRILEEDYYEVRASENWPPAPSGLVSPDSN